MIGRIGHPMVGRLGHPMTGWTIMHVYSGAIVAGRLNRGAGLIVRETRDKGIRYTINMALLDQASTHANMAHMGWQP